ncbi:hypothetical protein AYO47_04080 [Planctomyces sp. SCGC AG-212-M04]|nr:hypothetical protein AYO47_04080 [Planctomyces sp. SCGC AG-212-M04]
MTRMGARRYNVWKRSWSFALKRDPVMTKKKPAETGMDRLKALPLWQWGAIFIFAGMVSNFVMELQAPPANTPEGRGQALGRSIATLLFVVVGFGMILWDVLRKKPESKKQAKKRKNEHA